MKSEAPPPADVSAQEARGYLEATARAVRVMKASWLQVAMRLKHVRERQLWRHATPSCSSYEEYVHGVLQINRAIHRRMLSAVGYAEERRPDLLEAYESDEEVVVPSYDVLNRLRSAREDFAGREEEFEELEGRVFDEGIGRVTLNREIGDRLGRTAPDGSEEGAAASAVAEAPPVEELDLKGVLDELKRLEKELLRLEASPEVRQLMFRLIETVQKETRGGRASRA